ncbi:MAG: RDD family protein, partial [Verrucomicrobiota bacterium]
QGTLGKRLVKVVVCDCDGEPIKKKAAFIRLLARVLSVFTLGVGYLMVFFTDRHQTLHDKLSGAIVVLDD